jgi:16S rRNA (adenine1518-N6/adenine1519-N6)-dimethyltransferase
VKINKESTEVMRSPRRILKEANVFPIKQLGQNFLSDPSAAGTIVERCAISDKEVVLEIGAGLGALTFYLAQKAQKVYAVEKDLRLAGLLGNQLEKENVDNVILLKENILNIDVLKLYEEKEKKFVVVGNLPYNISSQILVWLINFREVIDRAVLMFQKELAQRIMSGPGCKDYGRLSVMLQYCSDIKRVARVKAHQFYPRPKVDSEVLKVDFSKTILDKVKDEKLFFSVIKAAFGKRRKTLKNALAGSELDFDANTILNILASVDIDPVRRAETLTVAEFVRLSNRVMDYK